MDVKDPTVSFENSRWAITSTLNNLQITALTSVERQAWASQFVKDLVKIAQANPTTTWEKIVAIKQEVDYRLSIDWYQK